MNRRTRRALLVAPLLAACSPRTSASPAGGGQIPDTAFVASLTVVPVVAGPEHPTVTIDQAHHNFHTASGRFRAFAQLVQRGGFQVREGRSPFDAASLAGTRILVISNALDARQTPASAWTLPAISAFTQDEIAAVSAWVRGGGSLLLIADHMPFAGAASDLAAALGVRWANGFAIPPSAADGKTGDFLITFRRSDGGLTDNPISDGASAADRVDSVTTFTGSAFWIDPEREPTVLLRLPAATRILLPQRAWQFTESTRVVSGADVAQGAAFPFGKGKVAVFGEAAMFSAQLKGPDRVPMGMNNPIAAENPRFILNLVRWLASSR